jgi:hypothetical protein
MVSDSSKDFGFPTPISYLIFEESRLNWLAVWQGRAVSTGYRLMKTVHNSQAECCIQQSQMLSKLWTRRKYTVRNLHSLKL